jgi:hypothetical protein
MKSVLKFASVMMVVTLLFAGNSAFTTKAHATKFAGLFWYSSPTSSTLIDQMLTADEEDKLNTADPAHTYSTTQASGGVAFEYGYTSAYPHTGQTATIIYQNP